MSLIDRCRAKVKAEREGQQHHNPAIAAIRESYLTWPDEWIECLERRIEAIIEQDQLDQDSAEVAAYAEIKPRWDKHQKGNQ